MSRQKSRVVRRRSPDLLIRGRTYPRHIVIPDTQVKPGVATDHIAAAGNYVAEKEPDTVIVLGDWYDNPMLSTYEPPGSMHFQGTDKTIIEDIRAGNKAMDRFLMPIRKMKKKPRLVFLMGNHEDRMMREVNRTPRLRGLIDYSMLLIREFEIFDFLKIVHLDGVMYSHYFINPQSLKGQPLSGTMDNRLNKLKKSFTQGHQQTRMWGSQWTTDGHEICGLVAGAFYEHDEDYLGPQRHYWRGIVVKNEVRDGQYDPMFVSLDYLKQKYL